MKRFNIISLAVLALTASACSAPTEPEQRVIECFPICDPTFPSFPEVKILQGVWGSSSTDVFAVGYSGTILHYDGNTWSVQASGIAVLLSGVWGSSATDVFAVGGVLSATILHYDGTDWSAEVLPSP